MTIPLLLALASFSGQFETEVDDQRFALELEATAGKVIGRFSVDGQGVPLSGTYRRGHLRGNINLFGQMLPFEATKAKGGLMVTMQDPDDPTDRETVLFRAVKRNTAVFINGRKLSARQIAQLENQYGVAAKPGRYWYDARSGLYGVIGYGAFGFMRPGHDFGRMKRRASNGGTGVVVNGRELPQAEWTIWSMMLGTPIQRGRYWFDASGNAGYEGNPMPLVNFYAAAQRRTHQQRRATQRGGDNFWSTRFSAGNSNADNSQGYVSVPGYGPVGYGF